MHTHTPGHHMLSITCVNLTPCGYHLHIYLMYCVCLQYSCVFFSLLLTCAYVP